MYLKLYLLFVLFTDSVLLEGKELAPQKTYYIDATAGNDENAGTSINKPWKSFQKINQHIFKAGEQILLRAGGTWTGQLKPGGSGKAGNPIRLGRYGHGPDPVINGNGIEGEGVVMLFNQSYWEISNLEIVNDAATAGDRKGVEIRAANYGTVENIHLKNLHIHHIKGIAGHGLKEKKTAAIYITVTADSIPTRYNDLLIEGCNIHHVENQGIVTNNEVSHSDYPGTESWHRRKITNLHIRNNVLHHISKNAMIIRLDERGLVERNLCYETALGITGNTIFSRSSLGTVYQYNEGYLNRSPDYDGSLYDADISSPGTIWQYSYSHDNAHGLMWFCTDQKDTGVIVRYNLSQNDRGKLIYINYAFSSAQIYNNVFYTNKELSPVIIAENPKNDHNYTFLNNIIYNESAAAAYQFAITGKGQQQRVFSHNIFYGLHPAGEPVDTAKIITDPHFTDPGSATTGLESARGYRLRSGSPAIGSGILIVNNGALDYFGNTIHPLAKPNRGIDNSIWDTKSTISFSIERNESSEFDLTAFIQEMQRHRALVYSRFVSKGHEPGKMNFWHLALKGETPFQCLLRTASLSMKDNQVKEKELAELGLWPYQNIQQLDNENDTWKSSPPLNKRAFGPTLFNSQEYYDYKLSTAILKIK